LLSGLTDAPGGQAVRFGNNSGNDMWWGAFNGYLMPFDPNSLYEVGVVVRRNAGSGSFYCGLEGVAADRVTLINISGSDSAGSQHYLAASNVEPGSSWTTYVGYVKGHSGSPNTANRSNPSAPGQMYTGVAFIRPMLIVNYNGAAGQMDGAALWVRRLPGSLAAKNSVGTDEIDNGAVDLTTKVSNQLSAAFAGFGVHELSGSVTTGQLNANILAALQAVIGNLAAISAELGSAVISTTGHLRSGQTAYDTGDGWLLGHDGSEPCLSMRAGTDYFRYKPSIGFESPRIFSPEKTVSAPTWVGFSSDPLDLKYRIAGGNVVLWGGDLGTSNDTECYVQGLPSEIRPSGERNVLCLVRDAGSIYMGLAEVRTTGEMVLYKSNVAATAGPVNFVYSWTASGNKGLVSQIVYPL